MAATTPSIRDPLAPVLNILQEIRKAKALGNTGSTASKVQLVKLKNLNPSSLDSRMRTQLATELHQVEAAFNGKWQRFASAFRCVRGSGIISTAALANQLRISLPSSSTLSSFVKAYDAAAHWEGDTVVCNPLNPEVTYEAHNRKETSRKNYRKLDSTDCVRFVQKHLAQLKQLHLNEQAMLRISLEETGKKSNTITSRTFSPFANLCKTGKFLSTLTLTNRLAQELPLPLPFVAPPSLPRSRSNSRNEPSPNSQSSPKAPDTESEESQTREQEAEQATIERDPIAETPPLSPARHLHTEEEEKEKQGMDGQGASAGSGSDEPEGESEELIAMLSGLDKPSTLISSFLGSPEQSDVDSSSPRRAPQGEKTALRSFAPEEQLAPEAAASIKHKPRREKIAPQSPPPEVTSASGALDLRAAANHIWETHHKQGCITAAKMFYKTHYSAEDQKLLKEISGNTWSFECSLPEEANKSWYLYLCLGGKGALTKFGKFINMNEEENNSKLLTLFKQSNFSSPEHIEWALNLLEADPKENEELLTWIQENPNLFLIVFNCKFTEAKLILEFINKFLSTHPSASIGRTLLNESINIFNLNPQDFSFKFLQAITGLLAEPALKKYLEDDWRGVVLLIASHAKSRSGMKQEILDLVSKLERLNSQIPTAHQSAFMEAIKKLGFTKPAYSFESEWYPLKAQPKAFENLKKFLECPVLIEQMNNPTDAARIMKYLNPGRWEGDPNYEVLTILQQHARESAATRSLMLAIGPGRDQAELKEIMTFVEGVKQFPPQYTSLIMTILIDTGDFKQALATRDYILSTEAYLKENAGTSQGKFLLTIQKEIGFLPALIFTSILRFIPPELWTGMKIEKSLLGETTLTLKINPLYALPSQTIIIPTGLPAIGNINIGATVGKDLVLRYKQSREGNVTQTKLFCDLIHLSWTLFGYTPAVEVTLRNNETYVKPIEVGAIVKFISFVESFAKKPGGEEGPKQGVDAVINQEHSLASLIIPLIPSLGNTEPQEIPSALKMLVDEIEKRVKAHKDLAFDALRVCNALGKHGLSAIWEALLELKSSVQKATMKQKTEEAQKQQPKLEKNVKKQIEREAKDAGDKALKKHLKLFLMGLSITDLKSLAATNLRGAKLLDMLVKQGKEYDTLSTQRKTTATKILQQNLLFPKEIANLIGEYMIESPHNIPEELQEEWRKFVEKSE